MIRILIFIAIIFALAMGYAWLADRPGTVLVNWLGTEVEVSVLVGVNILIAILVAGIIGWGILRGVFKTPEAVRGFFAARRRDKGYEALSRGFVAVGSGDRALALKSSKASRKFLPDESMTLMLEAQSAQLADDADGARAAFEAMLERPETRLLGLRGLFVEAQRHGNGEAARHFAEEAVAEAPHVPWASKALIGHQIDEADWTGALATLSGQGTTRQMDKATMRRHRAVLLTAQALDCEDSEPEKAKTLVLEAHRLAVDLVPAAALAGRILGRLGDARRAAKIVETTWKKQPHPDLLDAYEKARAGESGRELLRRVRHLIKANPDDVESRLALATALMAAQNWSEARSLLGRLVIEAPTRRACALMARLEQDETGDDGRVREWLSRALKAPRDRIWIADGVESEHWAPASPVTGQLDAFQWATPPEAISGPDDLMIDEAMIAAPVSPIANSLTVSGSDNAKASDNAPFKPVVIESVQNISDPSKLEPGKTIPDTATRAVEVSPIVAVSETDNAQNNPDVDTPSSEVSEASEPSGTLGMHDESEGKSGKPDGPRPVEFPLPHAPDDPGLSGSEQESSRARLF